MVWEPIFLATANLALAIMLRMLKPNVSTAALLAVVLLGITGYLGVCHGTDVILSMYHGRDEVLTATGRPPVWPPAKNRTYPDLVLLDQNGRELRLSHLRGRVILLEPIGMSCPACIAFSGGQGTAPFAGVSPQPNLKSIDEYVREFAGISLDDPRIVHVQVVLFNHKLEAPSPLEVRAWAQHFGYDRAQNHIVLTGTPELATRASREIVPGFHLIDQHFLLRASSSGDQPQDNLYTELLPLLGKLVNAD